MCFMRGGPIVVRRLLEAHREQRDGERAAGRASPRPFEGVHLVSLPMGDNISRAGAEFGDATEDARRMRSDANQHAIKETFRRYAHMVRPLLPLGKGVARDAVVRRLQQLHMPEEFVGNAIKNIDYLS